MRNITRLCFSVFLLMFTVGVCAQTTNNQQDQYSGPKYIRWLQEQSMLYNAGILAQQISGKGLQWQHPYAMPQSHQAAVEAPVWFSSYPSAMITKPGEDILQFLGDTGLWDVFSRIGIKVLHTGPMKLSGGITENKYTPTVDGWFDRIMLKIDPKFGTEDQYHAMVKMAKQHGALIAGDIIPGHTGKGADFLLAERNFLDYPGIYDMVPIKKQDWNLLPPENNQWQSANLSPEQVDVLIAKGYIPGHLQRVLFSVPGSTKPLSGWDATAPIKGVDGKVRRWVFMHYFKPGQPTMNWLDPSFAAERIVSGDIVKTIHDLGAKIVRLDANPFLGIEPVPGSKTAWSEGHPLSITSTNDLSMLVRKLGGWSFQELNLTLDAIHDFSVNGADLSYDFITRPAVEHAMLTGDATFLRMTMHLMKKYDISPNNLIHDMQNHDEITYELVHYADHANDMFNYGGRMLTGRQLRTLIVGQMHKLAVGPQAPYNRLSGNGLCTTFVGLIATRLGIKDVYHMSSAEKAEIKKGHILLAMFNSMQPGIFGLSGWDLVGALPLPTKEIPNLLKDGDYRWINRGGYDLMGYQPNAKKTADGIPVAQNLYGSLPTQLKDPNSFVSQIKHLIAVRTEYGIAQSKQIVVPHVQNPGAIIMVQQLPENKGYEITALNFGKKPITETVDLNKIKAINAKDLIGKDVTEILTNKVDSKVSDQGVITINLDVLQGKVLLVK